MQEKHEKRKTLQIAANLYKYTRHADDLSWINRIAKRHEAVGGQECILLRDVK